MHLFVWADDAEADLRDELARAFAASSPEVPGPAFLGADFALTVPGRLPWLAYSRQCLPDACAIAAPSIRGLATAIVDSILSRLPDDQPWALHVEPRYGVRSTPRTGARAWHSSQRLRPGPAGSRSQPFAAAPSEPAESAAPAGPAPEAGRQRARLVREATIELLQKRRRQLRRQLRPAPSPFTPVDALVQCFLTTPETAWLSVAPAPLPFQQRHLLSPFPAGDVPVASDKAAPSRAFAKLVEAELRLGRAIRPGETCVDLGAAPGSWTYVAARRGARVTAVDRSPLRADLQSDPRVDFRSGDAFRFTPDQPVDWLLCDVIAAADRSAALLLEWLRRGWCRHFVVTLKTGDAAGVEALARVKRELPPLAGDAFLTRLCANKKEVCAFGSAA